MYRDPDVENSGRYTCNVVNDVGAAMAASHVLVSDREGNNNTRTHLNIYKVSLMAQAGSLPYCNQ